MNKSILLSCLFMIVLTTVLGQNYWQQEVDYKIDIDFDVKKHQMTGSQKLVYTNNSPDTLFRAFYHLYFNAFQPNSLMDYRSRWIEDPDRRVRDRISKLSPEEIGYHKIQTFTQDGQPLQYEIQGTVVEIDLATPLLPGKSTTFDLTFDSQVPVQIRRSGRNNKEGISYSMAQWFPKIAEYDKKGWHPHPYVGREFYSPWGNYEVNIAIDKKYVVAATGILQNPDEIGFGYEQPGVKVKKQKGKKNTWQFLAENVHDFVWAADPDYSHTKVQIPDGPEVHFFFQSDTLSENWDKLRDYTSRAFQYIQKNFGKYPYSTYSVIQGGDGGMEYPMATLITGHRSLQSLVGVTVHEVLHSWYQMLLATNESYYAWMDEGFTSYASSLTMSQLFGGDILRSLQGNYRGYLSLALSGKEEPLSTHSDHFQSNFAYGRGSYSKGAVSIAQLGYIIGEENRDKGLLRYFDEWKFKHPDLNDFIRVMEKTSGIELDWYYEYWVNSTHTVDFSVGEITTSDNSTSITINRPGVIPMPVDVKVTMKSGDIKNYYIPLDLMRGEKPVDKDTETLSDWPWAFTSYSIQTNLNKEEIVSIEIDPSGLLADVNREDNTWSAED